MHQNINGDRAHFTIARSLNELRSGRAIYLRRPASGYGMLLAPAETASPALLARLEARTAAAGVTLIMTRQRAQTLGLCSVDAAQSDRQIDAFTVGLKPPASLAAVRALAGVDDYSANAARVRHPETALSQLCDQKHLQAGDALCALLLNLPKRAQLVPALLMIPMAAPATAEQLVELAESDIELLAHATGVTLDRISEARVPLAGHEACRLVLFRDQRDASEHVAILIGTTDAATVPVRVHSSCFTGDLLGSLRCDCGDQLRGAVEELAAAGGGVLLYLAQEGRGIGLANKLRAYELQDRGLNTIEADRHLGFNDDERSYAVAAVMLRQLAITRVHLLTNNLEKISALQAAGIDVVTDQRLTGSLNRHNARYLRAKRDHAGHLLPEIQLEESP